MLPQFVSQGDRKHDEMVAIRGCDEVLVRGHRSPCAAVSGGSYLYSSWTRTPLSGC